VSANLGSRDNDVYSIRGQSQPFGGADPGVQTYFAEVPFNSSGPAPYYDMANIQVLNGPQGTSVRPQHHGRRGAVRTAASDRSIRRLHRNATRQLRPREFDGALNVPIIGDTLMVRAAFDVANRNGFTQDTVITGTSAPYTEEQDNVDYQAFRFGVTWKPFSHFENYALFDYLHDSNNGTGAVLTGISPSTIGNLADGLHGFGPCTVPPTSAICGEVEAFQAQMPAALAGNRLQARARRPPAFRSSIVANPGARRTSRPTTSPITST
jgi:iron complex outermembrane receptor protein